MLYNKIEVLKCFFNVSDSLILAFMKVIMH